ncbi:MAG: polysaccharide deacetylase family protein [Patescibacteria group bacterium]
MLKQNKKYVNANKLTWINFLHWYQPANADGHIIKEATEMSYLRIIRALEEHPNIKFTFNISGCLILRWEELKYFDLIKRIKRLVRKGQIELTGSAAYHPILALISEKEASRQVKENEDILKYYLGNNIKLRGFFLPEMVYSSRVAKLIKKMGYEWLILDEIAYKGNFEKVDFDNVYEDSTSKMKIVFRSRKFSKCYVPDMLQKAVKKLQDSNPSQSGVQNDRLVITATDAELYGLRHNDPTAEFEKLLKNKKLETRTISQFIDEHKDATKIKPLACSWETTEKELKQKKPYILWYDKDNIIHKKLWQLASLVYKTVEKYKKDDNYDWARWHMVRGLASCTFWWASAKDFRLFGSISWSPDEIERGINELIRAIRAIEDVATRSTKIKAERLYIKIKQMIWEKHWKYYWKK